ncbi:sensor histidine kinase [Candidatus Terasakiella magnetica]|nr:ATP-binding protein [Candidatus Terasakiella magnetica]
MSYFVLDIVHIQDHRINQERSRFVKAVINQQPKHVGVAVQEYTLWNEAVEEIIEKKNMEFADDNIGSYMIETYDFITTLVLDPQNKKFMRFNSDHELPSKLSTIPDILKLANQLRNTAPKDYKVISDWINIDGKLYVLGVGAFTYQSSQEAQNKTRKASEKYVLVVLKHASERFWNDISKDYDLPSLSLNTPSGDGVQIPILSNSNTTTAILNIAGHPHIIQSIFERFGLAIFFIILTLVAITLFTIKKSLELKTAHDELLELNENMDQLVQQRTAELKQALSDTEKASNAKTAFLSSMSHELRTPLNGILGFAQLLDQNHNKSISEKEQNWLSQIIQAGNLLLSLVNDVLDMAHVESGKIPLSPETFKPIEVFKECYAICTPLANEKNIEIIGNPGSDCYVHVDRRRLKQVLLNLINNAIKYNREGGKVTIGCRNPDEETIQLFVQDTGYGISEEDREKVFEPFFRSQRIDEMVEGTGVGLPLVLRLAKAMGGEVSFESVVGEGTTFFIDFPICTPPK